MAAPTISKVGSNAVTAANASIATGATVTATTAGNDWLVVVVAAAPRSDNPTPIASCSDSVGNVYTLRAEVSFGSGAAGDGAALTFFTAPVTVNITSGTVTATGPDPCNERCIQVFRVRPAAGTISYITADNTGVGGNLTNHAAATVSVTNGNTIFGAAALETDDSVTGDSDTTNGSWSTVDTDVASGISDAESLSVVTQYKTVTATGNQSWACSTTSGRQGVCSYLVIKAQTAVALSLSAALGQYTLSGTAATMRIGVPPMVAGAGSYALTGTTATTNLGRIVPATVGSYSLLGTDANTLHAWKVAADVGSYALTGSSVMLSKTTGVGKVLSAEAGSYTLLGTDASQLHGNAVAATAGSYALIGTAAPTLHSWRISAGDEGGFLLDELGDPILDELGDPILIDGAIGGSYALTGSDVGLQLSSAANKFVIADAGSYVLTGTAVTPLANVKLLQAESGSYLLTGTDATLRSSAQPAVSPLHIGEWPVDKKRRRRREDAAAAEQRARKRFRDAIGRLLEGLPPEFDEPLDEALDNAVQAANLLYALSAPIREINAVNELIDHIRQLRIAQPIAQLHLAQAYNQAHRHLMAKAQEDTVMALLLGE